ncbi:MAG: hypothetical protein MH252_05040 [Thermosynechococcaceae cyanobacterium MS004]|nr:hypothetical protein [Thermosynechococcaceae cyanobacterium MS004]
MSKFKRSLLIGIISLMGVVLYGWVGVSQSRQPSVRLTTRPAISQITPFEAEATDRQMPVELTLQAVNQSGQPVENAKLHLQMLTPAKTPWFTTDFPISEGTTLLEMEAQAPKGELKLQQMLPIRGTYKLQVNVTPVAPNAFAPFQQTLTLAVPENGVKYRNLAVLVILLLTVGLGGGWVIGSKQPIQPGELAPQRVRLLLSGLIVMAIAVLLFVNISAELAQSQRSMAVSHGTEELPAARQPAMLNVQELEMKLSGDTDSTVGQLTSFQVRVMDTKTKQPATDVGLRVTTTQLENNWVLFAYQGIPDRTGTLAWKQQFFDGAPHSIEVTAIPQKETQRSLQPLQVSQNILVEGVAPPFLTRLISLAYFVGIVVVGLLIGSGLAGQLSTH